MQIGYTHLLFIDSDIDFQSKTIFTMLEKDLGCNKICPYPMKTFDWDKDVEKDEQKNIEQLLMQDDLMPKQVIPFLLKVEDPQIRYKLKTE